MGYKDKLDEMIWSFSRLHAFETCPYYFYLHYIEERDGLDNFYAENGSLMHEIFQKLLQEEVSLQDAPGYYIENYENICSKVKKSTMDGIFGKCLDYLCSVDALDKTKYKVLAVEKRYKFKIGKYQATGIVDLLLEDINTGEMLLVDHKSADHFLKKDGSVLKNAEDSFRAYAHQMYFYCKPVFEEYNKYPDKLVWHHFKDGGATSARKFNLDEYNETQKWAIDLIETIYKEKEFLPIKSWFNCNNICGYRDGDCEYKDEE